MTTPTVLQSPEIALVRMEKGKAAWRNLEDMGGIWPTFDADHTPAGILEGMGEYEPGAIIAIIKEALPKCSADRAWPWVARAIFIYENEVNSSELYHPGDISADTLVSRIAMQAKVLSKSLTDLAWLALRSGDEVGTEHGIKALQVSEGMRECDAVQEAGGLFGLGNALRDIAAVCTESDASAAKHETRGAERPHLALLVSELTVFWGRATRKKPSASAVQKRDEELGPFGRLVNGCLRFAGAEPATRWQLKGAIDRTRGTASDTADAPNRRYCPPKNLSKPVA